MRICIPTKTDEGLISRINPHFGKTPYFTVYDTQNQKCEVSQNIHDCEQGGKGSPKRRVIDAGADVVICYGLGGHAFSGLIEAGIKVFKAKGKTVKEAVDLYSEGQLKIVTMDDACVHKDDHHHGHDENECA
jgi:predicted Fe-Mo cluster-binding NifX family protein